MRTISRGVTIAAPRECVVDVGNWGYFFFLFPQHTHTHTPPIVCVAFADNLQLCLQVSLDFEVQFFGKKYTKFWPCANGLISFNDEVRASCGGCMAGRTNEGKTQADYI